ncbi:MAG: NusG domain II-containing protein [Candidatus Cloacimonadota bacterium]|nr:NusG domain II-containing protein [Candidatus Cloacimonadota bacterium]
MVKKYIILLNQILTVADKLLIVFVVVISVLLSFLILPNSKKQIVQISYQNMIYGEYDLTKDKLIKLKDELIVQIEDSKFRVLKSDCKNQICVNSGWSNYLPIICVPNKLSISLKKKEDMLITQ